MKSNFRSFVYKNMQYLLLEIKFYFNSLMQYGTKKRILNKVSYKGN